MKNQDSDEDSVCRSGAEHDMPVGTYCNCSGDHLRAESTVNSKSDYRGKELAKPGVVDRTDKGDLTSHIRPPSNPARQGCVLWRSQLCGEIIKSSACPSRGSVIEIMNVRRSYIRHGGCQLSKACCDAKNKRARDKPAPDQPDMTAL